MNCAGIHHWPYWIALGAWQAFEYWLGRTPSVQAGSTPELIFSGIESIVIWVYTKLK